MFHKIIFLVLSLNIHIIFAFVSDATPVFSCASHCTAADTISSSSISAESVEEM